MRILIVGAAGFIGQRLSRALLHQAKEGGSPYENKITELISFDKVITSPSFQDKRLKIETGDFCDCDTIRRLLDPMPDLIFHLAAIVSGEAEKDFDLGMKVNLHAVIQLLEFCKASTKKPMLVFASSCAVYGVICPTLSVMKQPPYRKALTALKRPLQNCWLTITAGEGLWTEDPFGYPRSLYEQANRMLQLHHSPVQ